MLERVLEPEVMDTAEDAREYAAIPHDSVNLQFVADALALGVQRGAALDLGAGPGQIVTLLAEGAPGLRVFGVDLADEMLAVAARTVGLSAARERIVLERRDVKHTGYPAQSFDLIVSNSVVHHLPEPEPFFREVRRLLRPGGAVLIRDLLRPRTLDELNRLVEQHASDGSPYQRKLFDDSLHAALTLAEARSFAGLAGLHGRVEQTSDRHWTLRLLDTDEPRQQDGGAS